MKSKQKNIKKIMEREGIDIAIISSPENFHYIVGKASHQHTVSRNPAMASAILYKDEKKTKIICMDFEGAAFDEIENKEEFDVLEYSTWVGAKTWETVSKNIVEDKKVDFINSFERIIESLSDHSIKDIKIGIELDYLPVNYYNELVKRLPSKNFININPLFIEARSIKTKEEIEIYKKLCSVVDDALTYISDYVKPGISENQLMDLYKKKVSESGICMPSSWSFITAGANSSRLGLSTDYIIKEGDIVKFDGGVNAEFDFYTTDTSRTWLVGEADEILVCLKQRLFEAQRLMIESMKPGLKISELFNIGFEYVKKDYPWYERGHLGHSISIGPSTSESPIICMGEHRPLEVGMVFCVEVPAYIKGVGGYNIEDMVLVTENGAEVLTGKTPHFLTCEKRVKN